MFFQCCGIQKNDTYTNTDTIINNWSRSLLEEEGTLTQSDGPYSQTKKDSLFNVLHVGYYLPLYRNDHAQLKWKQTMSTLSKSSPLDLRQNSVFSTYNDAHQVNPIEQCRKNQNLQFVHTMEDVIASQLYYRDQDEFKNLVLLGPPTHLRWSCWKMLMLINYQRFIQSGFYLNKLETNSEYSDMIKKDLNRTLISHPYFQGQLSLGQIQLQRVLEAIANTLPELGYCQGMNYVGGTLIHLYNSLLGLILIVAQCDEQLTFSFFLNFLIQPQYFSYFLFCEKMPLHDILAYITHKLIKKHFPLVHQNVKENQIMDSVWISKMIMTLFMYNFDLECNVRIWDYIVAKGTIRAIPEIITAIVCNYQKELENGSFEDYGILFSALDSNTQRLTKFKIGNVIYNAASQFNLTKKQISNYCSKLIQKQILKPEQKRLAEVFVKYENQKEFETAAQKLIKECILIKY